MGVGSVGFGHGGEIHFDGNVPALLAAYVVDGGVGRSRGKYLGKWEKRPRVEPQESMMMA